MTKLNDFLAKGPIKNLSDKPLAYPELLRTQAALSLKAAWKSLPSRPQQTQAQTPIVLRQRQGR